MDPQGIWYKCKEFLLCSVSIISTKDKGSSGDPWACVSTYYHVISFISFFMCQNKGQKPLKWEWWIGVLFFFNPLWTITEQKVKKVIELETAYNCFKLVNLYFLVLKC